jgi:hypothetical protein
MEQRARRISRRRALQLAGTASPSAPSRPAGARRRSLPPTLGIEETKPFAFSDGIAQAAPALRPVSATP